MRLVNMCITTLEKLTKQANYVGMDSTIERNMMMDIRELFSTISSMVSAS